MKGQEARSAARTWEESRSRDAQDIWRTADALIAEAARMENEARRMRAEAERLNRLAADVADGRIAGGAAS